MNAFRCFTLSILLVAPALAQTRALGSAVLEISNNLGYQGASVYFGGTLENESPHSLLIARSLFGFTPKVETGDGFTSSNRATLHWKHHRLLLGGGASASWLVTSAFRKGAIRPLVAAGFAPTSRTRVLGSWVFSGSDHWNHLQGPQLQLDHYFSPRWQFNSEAGVFRYHPTGHPEMSQRTGVTARIGVSYVLFSTGVATK